MHDTDLETAKRAAEAAWETYSARFERYDPKLQWIDEQRARLSFSVKKIVLRCEIEISKKKVDVKLNVPIVFNLFKKKAISVVEAEMRKWIAKAQAD